MNYKKIMLLLCIAFSGITMTYAHDKTPQNIAQHLQLEAHPDGGYFKEIYRAENGKQNITMIYALRLKNQYSTIHKLSYPEILQWVDGGSFYVSQMSPDGKIEVIETSQQNPVHIVPADYWFQIHTKSEFSLMTGIVSPAFSWEYFTAIEYDDFMQKYPQAKQEFHKPFNKIFQKPN